MRSEEDVNRVTRLAERGLNNCEIARATGIPRTTVRDWLAGKLPREGATRRGWEAEADAERLPSAAYAYLCGLYLGDGCIAAHPRGVYRLRVALDSRYPRIISECRKAMEDVMPASSAGVSKHPVHNVVEVYSYSKNWPALFPQHGPGPKHERAILLDPWQARILERNLEPLLRGLIHSDGCRVGNRVNGKVYPRYMFSNRSREIMAIFTGACDELGVNWTTANKWNVAVSRRADVARLDSFIGPKA